MDQDQQRIRIARLAATSSLDFLRAELGNAILAFTKTQTLWHSHTHTHTLGNRTEGQEERLTRKGETLATNLGDWLPACQSLVLLHSRCPPPSRASSFQSQPGSEPVSTAVKLTIAMGYAGIQDTVRIKDIILTLGLEEDEILSPGEPSA